MGKTIWELDFYSRPIFDENRKKRWEVLICESPMDVTQSPDTLFRFSRFTDNQSVNSAWLKGAIQEAIAQAPNPPQRIRFFRRQMNNMILKACEDAGIPAAPSRRTYALTQWLDERTKSVYPQEEGYDESAAKTSTVQYPAMNAIALPDAVRGDKADRWAIVSLPAGDFAELPDWEIAFGESFPLTMLNIDDQTPIPGLIIFSPRATPLAGWMSGLELGYLHLETKPVPRIWLETGASDSWILVDLKTPDTLKEGQEFEAALARAHGVHFLAIQSPQESEAFAGFWLLKTP
jgi:hypothetical protein